MLKSLACFIFIAGLFSRMIFSRQAAKGAKPCIPRAAFASFATLRERETACERYYLLAGFFLAKPPRAQSISFHCPAISSKLNRAASPSACWPIARRNVASPANLLMAVASAATSPTGRTRIPFSGVMISAGPC